MSFEQQILAILSDSNFHSGQALAQELGISRATVWNNIKKLQSYGLDVYSIRGKGYRVPHPCEVLDSSKIAQCIQQTCRQDSAIEALSESYHIELHWRLGSTNEYLMRSMHPLPAICISEMQRNGRGRRGKQWLSPPGGNIYFSMKWLFNLGPSQLSALSLAVSVGVMRVLRGCGATNIGVKWPNDIKHDNKKLAGILLEIQGEAGGPCTVVVGVGINVRMPVQMSDSIDQAWTDLERLSGKMTRRCELIAALVCELSRVFLLYEKQQLAPFLSEWQNNDQLFNKPVRVQMPMGAYTGVAKGVDRQGNLVVEQGDTRRLFASGEVSLRLDNERVAET